MQIVVNKTGCFCAKYYGNHKKNKIEVETRYNENVSLLTNLLTPIVKLKMRGWFYHSLAVKLA